MKAKVLYEFVEAAKVLMRAPSTKFKDAGEKGFRDKFSYAIRKNKENAEAILKRIEDTRKDNPIFLTYQESQNKFIETLELKDKPVPQIFIACFQELFDSYANKLKILQDTEIPDDEFIPKKIDSEMLPETDLRSPVIDEGISLMVNEKEPDKDEPNPKG